MFEFLLNIFATIIVFSSENLYKIPSLFLYQNIKNFLNIFSFCSINYSILPLKAILQNF